MSSDTAACRVASRPKRKLALVADSLSWTQSLSAGSLTGLYATVGYAFALVVTGILFLPLDRLIYRMIASEGFPGEVTVLLNRVEPFGHGYGVLLIALTLWFVGRIRRWQVALILCCSLGSGIAADIVKLFVGRERPNCVPIGYASDSMPRFNSLWESEVWLELFESTNHSFPSAHTATAFGLAAALSFIYPRGGWWFFLLAGLVGLQRVVTGYHHVSDTLIGAAIGLVVGTLIWRRYADSMAARRRSRGEWVARG